MIPSFSEPRHQRQLEHFVKRLGEAAVSATAEHVFSLGLPRLEAIDKLMLELWGQSKEKFRLRWELEPARSDKDEEAIYRHRIGAVLEDCAGHFSPRGETDLARSIEIVREWEETTKHFREPHSSTKATPRVSEERTRRVDPEVDLTAVMVLLETDPGLTIAGIMRETALSRSRVFNALSLGELYFTSVRTGRKVRYYHKDAVTLIK